ncbi:glycosyltransferase family 4 protein [Endozoicomonas sp. 8E]|uniref:glycosyltransferase family 4 protein n=1 Tax=Endozoicomonas sp. 8E TaxID=3035692 RepID=UPI0029392A0A|nr:glycosyltransferase family 4 protein [Endozoicomonas sp. 8E]WOG25817.1 glycosyltransferase family 4 protein [Endozoicomonas sp. 8E]
MKTKILFISTLYSPFQIDVVNSFEQEPGQFEYHIAFTLNAASHRGAHWRSHAAGESQFIHTIDKDNGEEYKYEWVINLIQKIKPTHIILGQWKRKLWYKLSDYAFQNNIIYGYWMEPPNFLLPKAIQLILKYYSAYRIRNADFFLTIGDRCEANYQKIASKKTKVLHLSYGQDLSRFLEVDTNNKDNSKVKFLFSGQLIKRHNIPWICKAIFELDKAHHNEFEVIIAAKGPHEKYITQLFKEKPKLHKIISYDRDYKNWEDRIRPFANADVLIYPTSHSGWGLVIPEAMAAGVVVLSTNRAEAARYFLRHNINGKVLNMSYESLYENMRYCIINKDNLKRMSFQARKDSSYGSSEYVSKLLKSIFSKQLAY